MKKILFLIVCFLPFVVACTQENKIKNDLTELELKDKVKSLRIINYEPIDKFGEITAGERLEGNRSYNFNEQGFILSFETFGKDGEIKTSQKIIYNEQNKKSEIRALNIVDLGDTKINFENKSVYKYNSKGNNVEILTFAGDKETAKEEYQYNLKNEKIEGRTIFFQDDGKEIFGGKEIYKYDDKGNLIEQIGYSSNGDETTRSLFVYDQKNNKVEEASYKQNTLEEKRFFKYNNENRKIKELVNLPNSKYELVFYFQYDNNGNELSSEGVLNMNLENRILRKDSYKYIYDDKGNWIEKIIYENGIAKFIIKRIFEYY